MKFGLFDAKVATLLFATMSAFGCSSAPLEDETVAETPSVSVSAQHLTALQDVARDLDAAIRVVDLAAKEQNLDRESQLAWTAARPLSLASLEIETLSKSETGALRVSSDSISALRARVDSFDPVLEKLDDQNGNLHPVVQAAYDRLDQSLLSLETIEAAEQQSVLGQKALRKRRCCMVYLPTGKLSQCKSMKATKVGANIACAALASTIPLAQMTVQNGRCSAQADCP